MKSTWTGELRAALRKEWRSEMRSRHGLLTSALFGVLALVAMAFASYDQVPPPTLAAGMLSATLLFMAAISAPRVFLAEEDRGTLELVLLAGRPDVVFLGKLLFNIVQLSLSSLVLSGLFLVLTNVAVEQAWLFALGVLVFSLAMAGGLSLSGALVLGAGNRWVLVGTVGLPLLLPCVIMAVGVLRVALGSGFIEGGIESLLALSGFAVVLCGAGPYLANFLWELS
jgi:ABC-type transport system involved in cytochrome c biogenesis permease component